MSMISNGWCRATACLTGLACLVWFGLAVPGVAQKPVTEGMVVGTMEEIPVDDIPQFPEPVEDQTWKGDGEIRLFTVFLTTGEVVTVEGYGDLVMDSTFTVQHLSLTLSEVQSDVTGQATGPISIHITDESSGFGMAGSSFQSSFSAVVQYPLLAEMFGYVPVLEDSFEIPAETATVTFDGEFISDTWAFGCMTLTIDGSMSELIEEISVCEYPIHDGGQNPCPADKKCDKKKLCLQPIVITDAQGNNPTTCPSFQATTTIWAKCCKEIIVKPEKKLKKPALRNLTVDTRRPTAEMLDIIDELKDDKNKPPNNDCVEVYCVARFEDLRGNPNPDIGGGAFTAGGGTASASVVVQSDSHPNNVAHEVGHAAGALGHPQDGSVMQPSGSNSVGCTDQQSKSNCKNAMKGNCKVKMPKEECCKTWEIDQ